MQGVVSSRHGAGRQADPGREIRRRFTAAKGYLRYDTTERASSFR